MWAPSSAPLRRSSWLLPGLVLESGTGELARPEEVAVFALAGLLAPGISQIFLLLALRDVDRVRARRHDHVLEPRPRRALGTRPTRRSARSRPRQPPLASGMLVMLAYAAVRRKSTLPRALASPALLGFLPVGILFGLSYVLLFEAYYRGKVTVVSPLVATESLWGVLLAALFLRRSELVGPRVVLGAALLVAGGALIGAFR